MRVFLRPATASRPLSGPTAWNQAMFCAVQLHRDCPDLDVHHLSGLQHPVADATEGHLAPDIPCEQNDVAGLHGWRGSARPVAGTGPDGNDRPTHQSVGGTWRRVRLPVGIEMFGWSDEDAIVEWDDSHVIPR